MSRIKKWATGAGVDKDTQAKAAKALAQWESKKAKNKAKGKKKSDHDLAASDITDADLLLLVALEPKCEFSAVDKVLMSAAPKTTALEQILALEG